LTPEAAQMPGYGLLCSPTLYPGQTVRARLEASDNNRQSVTCNLYLRYDGADDAAVLLRGPEVVLPPGEPADLTWPLNAIPGPIAEIGVEIRSTTRADGTVYLDTLTWDGAPEVDLIPTDPAPGSTMWQRTWVNAADHVWMHSGIRISQDRGAGLLIQGTRRWQDYAVEAVIRPHLARRAGLAARVQGQRRYYALLLCDDHKLRLVKALDGEHVLAETDVAWQLGETYTLVLRVHNHTLEAEVNGKTAFTVTDDDHPLTGGAVALICDEGRIDVSAVKVTAE
jgi:hypothetical protein